MTTPNMQEFKMDYRTDLFTSLIVYDLFNSYQTNNLEVIKSKILIRLGTAKGEWQADLDFGIPIGGLKQNNDNADIITQLIVDEILKVENVFNVQVVSSDVNLSTRLFSGSFNVNTKYGQTNVEASI